MKAGIIAICDNDVEYAHRLMQYIGSKKGVIIKTIVFTDKKALFEYVEENKADILLISPEMMDNRLSEEQIIILSPGAVSSELTGYPSIYKYQSSDIILRELLNYFAELKKGEGVAGVIADTTEIIGVYSPIREIAQTTFAVVLGKILSEEFSVLYISLEEFSIFEKVFDISYTGDLADLVYLFRQNPEALPIKLPSIVHNLEGLSYIPPMLYSEDLRKIKIREWTELIIKIAKTGIYDKIIIDIGSMLEDIFKMIDICDICYMPVNSMWVSLMKVSVYEEYLLKSEKQDVLNKTRKIDIPEIYIDEFDEEYLEKQLIGKLGECIRSALKNAA